MMLEHEVIDIKPTSHHRIMVLVRDEDDAEAVREGDNPHGHSVEPLQVLRAESSPQGGR